MESINFTSDSELSIESLLAGANQTMDKYMREIQGATKKSITPDAWGHLHVAWRLLEIIDDLYHVQNGDVSKANQRWEVLRYSPLADAAKRKYVQREKHPPKQKTL